MPGDVVKNQYYPWGNYNETNFWMGALSGGDTGKIRVTWSVKDLPQPCGYKAELFTFGNESASVYHENFTIQAVKTGFQSQCSSESYDLPKFSILFSKNDSYLLRSPYRPYDGDYSFLRSIFPVDASITPHDFNLIANTERKVSASGGAWMVNNVPQVECPCGRYKITVRAYINGTEQISTTITKNDNTIWLPNARYVVYATGVCSPPGHNVGGYGRTIRIEVDLKSEPSTRWTIALYTLGLESWNCSEQ